MKYVDELPPENRGALEKEGAQALRTFVENGGTLIAFNAGCDYVIQEFNIPVRNTLAKVASSEFSVPGSLARVKIRPDHPVTMGMPAETAVFIDRPIAFDRYAESKETGGFILIDPESYDTVALGIVEEPDAAEHQPAARSGRPLTLPVHAVDSASRLSGAETHARSIAKAISWRATGSLDTFIVTYVITGSSVFAGSIAVTEIITKILFYYFHERIWSFVTWGKVS